MFATIDERMYANHHPRGTVALLAVLRMGILRLDGSIEQQAPKGHTLH